MTQLRPFLGGRPEELEIPGEWRAALTERIRVAMGEKETTTSAGNTDVMKGVIAAQLPQAPEGEGAAEIGEVEVPAQTKSNIPDKNTWDNKDTDKLVLEITQQIFNELDNSGVIEADQNERNYVFSDIRSALYQDLYRPRNPGDPQYVEGNNYFASLTPLDQSINIAVATFEDLIERNGKDNWNLNFKTYRTAEIREELFEQELMRPEVYEALKGSALYMEADYTSGAAVQVEAANMYMMLSTMEPIITREALDRSDVNSYRSLISSYVKGAKPNDIKKGIFNTTAEKLPITESIARNREAQERQRLIFDRFAAEGNLKEGVNTLLGFLEDDDDGINKKARSRFLTYLENRRASQMRNGMPDDELIQFMFNETLKAGTATRFNEETQMEDESIWDTILREEYEKVQAVKNEKAQKEYQSQVDKYQKEQKSAQEKADKAQEKAEKDYNDQLKAQRTWLHTQLDAEDVLYKAAKDKPEDFRDDYLEDPSYRGQVDKLIEKYKIQGRAKRNADGDIVKYSDPMGMTPSGKFGYFPDITYRDKYTGDIVTIPHSEMDNHLNRMGDRLAYQLQSIYDQTAEDMFKMQKGAIPTLPFDPMKFMPQTRKGDLYTTSPTGEQIPLYPYADPNEMVGHQPFPGETLPGFQPEPEPAPRLLHPDYVPVDLPTPTPFAVGSSFNLSPFDQGMKDIPPPSPKPGLDIPYKVPGAPEF